MDRNPIHNVICSWCDAPLKRRLLGPDNYRPIKNFFCDRGCKGKWQIHQRELRGWTKEWLYQKYVAEGLDCTQIARIVNRNSKRVWEWLMDYGIETRSRGTDVRQHFKKGQVSLFKGRKHTKEARDKIRDIRLADGHVPYLKNGVHHLKGKTGPDTPNWKGGITPERQSIYSSEKWKKAVISVWKRDCATCRRCRKHHNETTNRGTFDIHHIAGFEYKRFRCNQNNLILLCRSCHKYVHSSKNETGEYINESH